MKYEKITKSGKCNTTLDSSTNFMELVGAYREALSTLNPFEKFVLEKISIWTNVKYLLSTFKLDKQEENKGIQNGQSHNIVEPKGQLAKEKEREKGKVGFKVYCKYITIA